MNKYGKNIIIGVAYRPPNGNFQSFEKTRNEILENINRENKLCYLMRDFNIDLFKLESCNYTNYCMKNLWILALALTYFLYNEYGKRKRKK
jgi:hypothetical protein